MTAKRQWAGLTALLCLAVLAVGFLFLVKPQHSKASSIKSQTASVRSQIASLRSQLAVLKDEQQNVVGEEAKLTAYEAQLPKDPQEPTLLRKVQDAATTAGVDLVTMNPGNPTAFTPPAAGGAAPATGATPSGSIDVIPVAMSVTGSYADLEQFLDSIEGLQRSMLVNTFSISYQGSTTATGPTVGSGELRADLTTQIFMAPTLGTPAAAGTTAGPTTTGGGSATSAS